ncbi:MAG: alpha-L-glutamate ligase-like protein [Chromatiaceae bacterium]|nr:MAG: alpha-L-glutamate ligase-like protein [Chromatiaceae bacterium]
MTRYISPARLQRLGMLGMNCRNVRYISRYNDRANYPLVDNKLKTKLLAEDLGVATPRLRLVVRTQHEISDLGRRLAGLEGFAIKPAKGSGGKGILVIAGRDGEQFRRPSGATLTLAELQRHLSNILAGLYSLGGTPDLAIVEDLIQPDPAFADYSFQGVPDIRIILFRGYPVMAMLRLATRASNAKANLHQGALGVGLDLASGQALNAVQFGRPIRIHPDTGADLLGLQVANWEDLLQLAARCYELAGLGYMGADLVVDAVRGPLLLELNARPGLAIQVANGMGLLPRLQHLEARRRLHHSPAARVAYAIHAFRRRDLPAPATTVSGASAQQATAPAAGPADDRADRPIDRPVRQQVGQLVGQPADRVTDAAG